MSQAIEHLRELPQTPQDAQEQAQAWAAAWNSGDLEAVLARFDESAVFSSPVAQTIVGTSAISGKQALRDYWTKALATIGTPHFVVNHAAWDLEAKLLIVLYTASFGGTTKRACEQMFYNDKGLVTEAHALYGAIEEPNGEK